MQNFITLYIEKPDVESLFPMKSAEFEELGPSTKDSLRRSKLETSVDVLRVIAEGAIKPTHIMYRANLSWTAMQYYLNSLLARGLVAERHDNGGRKNYELTEKGYSLLNDYISIRKQLNSEGITP